MTCPLLEYRREANDKSFDDPRGYCTAADRFVQPMRADICNDRYDLEHETDCEIFIDYTSQRATDDVDSADVTGDATEETQS